MRKKTKIVATISNLNCEPEFIKSLYDAGMDVVRLNTAHMNFEQAEQVIINTRKVSDKIAILIDTKGPEIRTVAMKEPIKVVEGDIIHIKGDPLGTCHDDYVCLSYPGIFTDVPVGSQMLFDDGDLEMIVIDKKEECLICEVKNAGWIQGRKSVNIPSVQINLPAITQKDIGFINFAAQQNVDFIAHSFVRKAADIIAVQSILDSQSSHIKIIAKIENKEGVDNIDSILDYAYGIMVARGDLALEISLEKLPMVQKDIVTKCNLRRKPVIVATQMLHTMIESPRPTRAEVNDIANAILEGSDALMLSGETAYGKYPIESVKMMTAIALEVEASLPAFVEIPKRVLSSEVGWFLVYAAINATKDLPVKAIVADTTSGTTVRALSAYRSHVPIKAQCYSQETVRMLSLSYGVYAHFMEPKAHHHEFAKEALQKLLDYGCFEKTDLVVIIAGSFGRKSGTTFIEIGEIDNLMHNHE